MSWLDALLLGLVQGLTEFFPVSSSAHLRLVKWLLGVADGEHLLYFDLLCHAGTWFALLWYLRAEVKKILSSPAQIALFSLALLPLVPAYFLLKPARLVLSQPHFLGWFLLATSGLLFLASLSKKMPSSSPRKWPDMLWIGAMQAMALIPGISRSGSTIAAARLRGWEWTRAAKFSFLLALPTIFGGEILETFKLFRAPGSAYSAVSPLAYGIGFLTSFSIGLFAVRFVFRVYETGKIRPFAWYCLAIGLFALAALR